MKKRPHSVTIIAWVFILAGAGGIVYHLSELKDFASRPEVSWVLLIRLSAILGGIFVLRGANWARWLLVAWIVYHVVLSFYHPLSEFITHTVIMIAVIFSLFHPAAKQYFRPGET